MSSAQRSRSNNVSFLHAHIAALEAANVDLRAKVDDLQKRLDEARKANRQDALDRAFVARHTTQLG